MRDIRDSLTYVVGAVVVGSMLSGCFGGSSGGGGGSTGAAGTITGAVAGTVVAAVDANGNILATDDTAGRTRDVDRDGDGTNDAFSFTLNDVPANRGIRIFLITDGVIHPMFFDTDGDGTPDTNVFSLAGTATVSLGFVDAVPDPAVNRAVPQTSPADNPAVVPGTADPSTPAGINSPPTAGKTLSELIDEGVDALQSGWVLGARALLEAAVAQAGTTVSNDADTARFLFALTRVTALGFDILSDGDASGLDRLGDILDASGVADDETRGDLDLVDNPATLPASTPTGAQLQDFLFNAVRAELDGAVQNLDAISTTFNTNRTDPIDSAGGQVELDYGDVLFFRAMFKTVLASIAAQRAYDLNVNIADFVNNGTTVADFLASNAAFLSLADAGKLSAEATSYATGALDDLSQTLTEVTAETDDQTDDLVQLPDLTGTTVTAAQNGIAAIKDSIQNGSEFVSNDSARLNLKTFFDGGVDFRNPAPGLLPPFLRNDVSGLLPDASLSGVVLAPDLNEDLNLDGVPDRLQ